MAELREVPVRELRNHTTDVLRRVAAGESPSVTGSRKRVADLEMVDLIIAATAAVHGSRYMVG